MYLTTTEAVLTLQRPLGYGEPPVGLGSPLVSSKRKGLGETQNAKRKERKNTAHSTLRMKLVGANVATVVEGLEPLPGKSNYFIGNDPAKWRTDIPTYAKVRYKAIYPGADLVYYGNQQQLEYDFVLAPGADPRIIRLAIAGSEKLEAGTDGGLVLRTTGGEVRLHKPIVYQQVSGTRKEVTGRYVLRGKREIGFEVAAYDANRPLIIDPVLSYSTYLGGSAGDFGNAIAVDASGNAYITGFTNSANFPTKNAFQAALGAANDAFVAKLDPTGSALVYSTFLGGTMNDFGNGIAVDASGNAYVTGSTNSVNFPTKNPFQAAFGGGGSDVFVAKLDTTGSLIYSTFLGGSGDESGNGIAVDASGNTYFTGFTNSANFKTKSPNNPFQAALGGASDAFVAKLDTTGSLIYSTFLGG
ncbi:MAG: SBBP repeat-containing protein, partial [Candidatus Acidiferrum sp.]